MHAETKAWGTCYHIFKNSNVNVDLLRIEPGGYCSLHKHQAKHNLFYVLKGILDIELDLHDDIRKICLNQENPRFIIAPGIHHRFTSYEGCRCIEISFVKINDNDIIRFSESGIIPKIIKGLNPEGMAGGLG